ncbi:MAG: sugar ABC transporter ATP-binding protein [Oscillospiraceae bacterium]|jgi:ribose transport system ATP-binding protein
MSADPMLQLKNVSKSFPGVKALKNVDFSVYPNEIVGLSGENGAGKSTLIKILGGVYQPDEGTIEFCGEQTKIPNTNAAINMGISVIYQELSLVPELSVAENLFLGAVPQHAGKIDYKTLFRKSQAILDILGLELDLKGKVGELSISTQQLVEIGKALARDAKLLIMDEPTSSLGREDVEKLFDTMRNLKAKGYGIIFITHRMEELFQVTDRITVMRDGEIAETRATSEWNMDDLVFSMVNRKIEQFYPKRTVEIGAEVLAAEGLGNKLIHDIHLKLHSGEIVGVAGLVGSGRSDLLKTICGAYPVRYGRLLVDGKPCKIRSPREALKKGIAFVPENRKEEGLVLESTVKENIVLSVLDRLAHGGVVRNAKIDRCADCAIDDFKIKTPSCCQKVVKLSGGNQQKIILSRVAETEPEILLLDEPTRGIDIGTKVEIYNKIMDFAEKGTAILLVSSDMAEILELTDRVYVMKEGRIVAELETRNTDSKEIMDYSTGGK